MQIALVLIGAYILGAIPLGLLIGKFVRGIDIRDYGSGNIGATNVMRTLGPIPATCVFIGDALKGFIPVAVASAVFKGMNHSALLVIATGLLAIIGHNASVFIKFKGGKGVSTSLGVIIGLSWQIALVTFIIWTTLVLVTRYVSIASIIASCSVCVMMHFSYKLLGKSIPVPFQAFAAFAALMIVVKHVSNIKRLLNGTEPKIGQKVKLEDH